MNFNVHSSVDGQHAFLGASKYHWVNYDEEKISDAYRKFIATQKGTETHAFAATCIKRKQKLPSEHKTLDMYVNDAIKYNMNPEQVLYYSENAFGTADAISFDENRGILRIHDLKTGVVPGHVEQLLIYTALFSLEYRIDPFDIKMLLRIYQADQKFNFEPKPEEIVAIKTKIINFDHILTKLQKEEG